MALSHQRVRPFLLPLQLLAVLWAVHLLNGMLLDGRLLQLGVQPSRSPFWHVFSAPLIHGSTDHLLANSLPFVLLGSLVLTRGRQHFWRVTLVGAICSGLGIWFFAPAFSQGYLSRHVGASGVIFGYLGDLLLLGWFERRAASVLLSLITAIAFGNMVFGVLPAEPDVSWQGHLFGFLGGVLAAWISTRSLPPDH